MFEVGKLYKFGENIAKCEYSGPRVVVLKEPGTQKEYTPCAKGGLSYWKEYTPPKVHKWYVGIAKFTNGNVGITTNYKSEKDLRKWCSGLIEILKIIEIEYTEGEAL